MRENDAWFGHGSLRWWEEDGLTSVHYMLGPWKEDKDFVSSAYALKVISFRWNSGILKLYIYGYLNRVQSSRRLEREAGRNVEVKWLIGRLAPDHKTIADFRKDNGPTIRRLCASRFYGRLAC